MRQQITCDIEQQYTQIARSEQPEFIDASGSPPGSPPTPNRWLSPPAAKLQSVAGRFSIDKTFMGGLV
jgi:hypothetical protein